ncbi:ABC-F family ATP-binding cassette domain-containing protein [Williamsia serinedens]|uniref:ATPase components of ABC transporters with duplicated ATPase domains n=1 Tax=Williamsia serinedens TaxID=391736 RepID=A0ABT1GVZ5_9NOCA|nr:ABC-F family ATP-binding cassette domain-containing protein [Williamsia serinedens]MCP2159149.1 ATPase components of ABC transporters with duplicated ATPase domains [Williamsia serinedens]
MSAVLHLDDVGASRGNRVLFEGLDLVVAPGDVVGLVGANGAGKSTLLGVIAGNTDADHTGAVTVTPPDATVGLLTQEVDRRPGESVHAFLARRTGVTDAQQAMDDAAAALADAVGDDDPYTPALERWLALGGADLDDRVAGVLTDVGLDVDPGTAMTALSGGQAARAGLAAILLSRHDVLLLDEPTNDLDLAGLARLERFVAEAPAAMMLVSHDREFLARTATGIVELDRGQNTVAAYSGGYEAYLAEREIARRHARERYEEYADTKAGLEERARTQRNWLEHGVRNARRKATDNDTITRKHRAESTEKQAAKARQTQRRIERLDVVEEPRKEWELRMEIARAPRGGGVVATLHDVVVERGDFTLGPISTSIDAGDRILVTGRNGSGKSTLLSVILGRTPPDRGTVSTGSGVELGEIDQARAAFTGPQSLTEAFRDRVPDETEADVRTLLAKFGLRGDDALRPAADLSPGERTRAALALLQARGVNLLVLDEPTNHLDLPAIEQLESALDTFDGTLLLVTHDRRMLDTVRATRRWTMDAGRLDDRLV